jgi:hypothetical protein
MHKGRRGLIGLAGAAALQPALAAAPVDLALVLAVDVSRSIDDDEARLQRQGYVEALRTPRVLAAIRGGNLGAIGLAYVEWAGWEFQRLVIPWRKIETSEDVADFTIRIEELPRISMSWTSISGAIAFSLDALAQSGFEATRQVIDVSGDGVNNSGPAVADLRARALRAGVVINGLPIVNDRPTFGRPSPVPLDTYYRDEVIGGPGAFLEVAENFDSFGRAVLRKLLREIA